MQIHKLAQVKKHFAHVRNFLQMCKMQMCKCANVQKCVVHKMRKSAAQIFFQMQKLQFAQKHKCRFYISENSQFALDTILQMQISFCVMKHFLCALKN